MFLSGATGGNCRFQPLNVFVRGFPCRRVHPVRKENRFSNGVQAAQAAFLKPSLGNAQRFIMIKETK